MNELNWTLIMGVGVVAMIGAFVFFMRRQVNQNAVLIDEDEFLKNLRKGQLIDLRKLEDYEAGHINGARHIAFARLNKSFGKLRADQPVYLYCENGKKCKRASLLLTSRGYSDVYCLAGGIGSWTKPLKTKK